MKSLVITDSIAPTEEVKAAKNIRIVPTAAVDEVVHLADDAAWFMDYRNADGSLSEMCGNGARVFARYLVTAGLVADGPFRIATRCPLK